jgi:AcrR family transcriptional regulator
MDPRIARTRRSLREALFSLARERAWDEISVTDIADRAGVNRSTYYQHYSDKDTLLAEALDAVIDSAVGDDEPPSQENGQQILLTYLEHVREHASLYRVLLGELGSAGIQVRMQRRLDAIILDALDALDAVDDDLPGVLTAAAISGSALAMVRVWVEMPEPPEPEVAAAWIWQVLDRLGAMDRLHAGRGGAAPVEDR